MKIISDFDGVFTTQYDEAKSVGRTQLARLTKAMDGDEEAARELIERARSRVEAAPEAHGWIASGILSCYADEDPYVFQNAVATVIYDLAPEEVVKGLAAQGLPNHEEFSRTCFNEGTEAWRQDNDSHLEEAAMETLENFLEADVEVVIVSNSSTERVRSILTDSGTMELAHGNLRLRGGAMKFVVTGDRPEGLPESEHFGRPVKLRRGHYYDILMEEKPDAIIGDVFSLDIALPALLRNQPDWGRETLVSIRKARHTPEWALEACRKNDIHILDSLAGLPDLIDL